MSFSNFKLSFFLLLIFALSGCSQSLSKKPDVEPLDANATLTITEAVQKNYDAALNALKNGNNKRAKEILLNMTQAYPNFSGPFANLGNIYLKEQDYDKAETAFKKSISINPKHAEFYNQLGILYRAMGRFRDAKKAYDNALKIDINYANAELNLGILYDLFLRDSQKAHNHYERYQSLQSTEDKQVKLWLADVKIRIKREASQ